MTVFYIYICCFSTIIYAWHIYFCSGFKNETNAILEFYFWFRFWPRIISCMWFCFGLPIFIQIWPPTAGYDVISIFQDGCHTESEIYFRFPVWWRLALEKVKTIRVPNFAKISQRTAGILLLPGSENKRLPYWKSASGFHFDVFVVICCSPLVYQISSESDNQWWRHHGDFQDCGRQPCWICFRVVSDQPFQCVW